ncbi:MAG: CPXCG motif-containing cysteine-rich protein [Lysobacterales bacterium]
MPRPAADNGGPPRRALLSAAEIDQMYGLEPVFEPGRDRRLLPLTHVHSVCCPHCWQAFDTAFEAMATEQDRIEDCPHCCGPIQLFLRQDELGRQELSVESAS